MSETGAQARAGGLAPRPLTRAARAARAQFELRFRNTYKTNGGYMIDAAVTFEDRETTHRVIIGREYYEDFGLEAQEVVAMVFRFLLARRVPRQTEGAPAPPGPNPRCLVAVLAARRRVATWVQPPSAAALVQFRAGGAATRLVDE